MDVKQSKIRQNAWAIVGVHGLYTGWEFTRKDMIEQHVSALGKTWSKCRSKGDRCIKVRICDGWYVRNFR